MSAERTSGFSRNDALEALLERINADLGPAEAALVEPYLGAPMTRPVVLVMGALRSGTTLFMQWLAETGLVAYPSNLLSRFYAAPIIGARIQLMLTDPRYRFRDEFEGIDTSLDFRSANGKTRGLLAPNEFWYFWRRFLADPAAEVWPADGLGEALDAAALKAELVGLMDVFGKPFAAKGMLFNYQVPVLDRIFEQVLFVHVERDPVANVASALEARERQFGDVSQWYSFRIPGYDELVSRPPAEQAAAQVVRTNRALEDGLARVAGPRWLHVSYESFCAKPAAVYEALVEKLGLPAGPYAGPAEFTPTRRGPVPGQAAIEAAIESVSGPATGRSR